MKKFLFLVIAVVFSTTGYTADINAVSNISNAVVYPSGARITRNLTVTIPQGIHTILIDDISAGFDHNSLRAGGSGTAGLKIAGVQVKYQPVKEVSDKRVEELKKSIEEVDVDIVRQKNLLTVTDKKEEFLNSFKFYMDNQWSKELATQTPSVEQLGGWISFIDQQHNSFMDGRLTVQMEMKKLQEKRNVLQRELGQLNQYKHANKTIVAVDVEAEAQGSFDLTLSYNVHQVSWYPVYDARAAFIKKEVALTLFAEIQQRTGEDWNDVNVTISTSRPQLGGNMPEIQPWFLAPYQQQHYAKGPVRKLAARSMVVADAAMFAAPMEMEEVSSLKKEIRLSEASVDLAGARLEYKLPNKVTLLSDGSHRKFPLQQKKLNAQFEYETTPRLAPYAYLMAKVTNAKDTQLLPGQVHVFLDDAFIGKSQLEKMIAPEQEFDLSLGVDEGVDVEHKLVERKTDDTLIGGISSSRMKEEFIYKMTLKNHKNKAIKISLYDHLPIPQDDKIKIRNLTTKPEPKNTDIKNRRGVSVWEFKLLPHKIQEVDVSFIVDYPREMNISGL